VTAKPKAYYFGYDGRGHHLLNDDFEAVQYKWGDPGLTPWGTHPDGTLAPKGAQIEGEALLHQKDGWTALAFWDRSGDSRGNSNSAFFIEGTYTFDEMLALCKERFALLFQQRIRSKFEIKQVDKEPNGDD